MKLKEWQLRWGGILHYLVCRASGKDELAVRVKRQAVDLCNVGIYCMAWFGGVVWASVPTEIKRHKLIHLHYEKRKKWHMGCARLHNLTGKVLNLPIRCDLLSRFLHHELLVICYRSKEWLMKQVPGDIFHHSSMTGEDRLCINYLPLLWYSTYIPQTDRLQIKERWIKAALILQIPCLKTS